MGAVAVAPVQAHHSFPATYVVDQRITIEGTVVQFLFRNPHSFVHVIAPDKSGVMQTGQWNGVRVARSATRCHA